MLNSYFQIGKYWKLTEIRTLSKRYAQKHVKRTEDNSLLWTKNKNICVSNFMS